MANQNETEGTDDYFRAELKSRHRDWNFETEILTSKQIIALECLLSRQPGETNEEVARRAGISRVTFFRYCRDANFQREYRARVNTKLANARGLVADALLEGAINRGHGQAAMQKIYWTMLGELKDTLELTGKDGKPIDLNLQQIPLDKLSLESLEKMQKILEVELGVVVPAASSASSAKLIGAGDASDHHTTWTTNEKTDNSAVPTFESVNALAKAIKTKAAEATKTIKLSDMSCWGMQTVKLQIEILASDEEEES